MSGPVLFIDDGGVISDNAARPAQWHRLLGEFLVPRLGGSPDAWAAADREVMSWSWARGGFGSLAAYTREVAHLRDDAFGAAQRAHDAAWLGGMCSLIGLPVPCAAECVALAEAATAFVAPQVRAAFPDAVDTLRTLHAAGHTLHTASGERSRELDGYLRALDVRQCFGPQLYGVDLVRMPKVGPEFYARIFADAGVSPSDALVVDDSPLATEWARAAGARALLLDRTSAPTHASESLTSLADLPVALTR